MLLRRLAWRLRVDLMHVEVWNVTKKISMAPACGLRPLGTLQRGFAWPLRVDYVPSECYKED